MVGHGRDIAHVGAEQHRQHEGLRRQAEALGDADGDGRAHHGGGVVGHHIGQHGEQQHQRPQHDQRVRSPGGEQKGVGQVIRRAGFHEGAAQRQAGDHHEKDRRVDGSNGPADGQATGQQQQAGAGGGADGDGHQAGGGGGDDRHEDAQGDGRLARLGQIDRGVQHQEFGALLQAGDLLPGALHQQNVAGPQQGALDVVVAAENFPTGPVQRQRHQLELIEKTHRA